MASIEKMSLVCKLSPSQWIKVNLPSVDSVGSLPYSPLKFNCYQVVIPKQAVSDAHFAVSHFDSVPKVSLVPIEEVGRVDKTPFVQVSGVSFFVP